MDRAAADGYEAMPLPAPSAMDDPVGGESEAAIVADSTPPACAGLSPKGGAVMVDMAVEEEEVPATAVVSPSSAIIEDYWASGV